MQTQPQHQSQQRLFRAAILNGVAPPADVIAQLEAVGINVGELEARLRQSFAFKS